jgi:hypothetical protein
MKTIFHIEDRGYQFIFHWVSYMLGGLRHIDTGNSIYGSGGGGIYEKNINNYSIGKLKKPFYLYFSKFDLNIDYIKQSLDLISDDFILIKESEINNDDIVINNFGEKFYDNGTHLNPEVYFFLKNLFLDKINQNDTTYIGKKYFIRRDKSHLLIGNKNENEIKRRQIINENELCESLKLLGIDSIYLEDLPFVEKIKLFNQSEIIISPNSGSLTFSIFSNPSTKIIEINTESPHQISHQYKSQCDVLDIPYFKLISKKIDDYDNMYVDPINLISLLKKL